MTHPFAEHHADFREEAGELFKDLEEAILIWEQRLDDREMIDRIFRAIHTIKGAGGMLNFKVLTNFAHQLESVLALVRSQQLQATRDIVDLVLQSADELKRLVDSDPDIEMNADVARIMSVCAQLIEFAEESGAPQVKAALPDARPAKSSSEPPLARELACYRIRFRPDPETLCKGTDLMALFHSLRELGETRIIPRASAVPALDEIEPERVYLAWDVLLTTTAGLNEIRDAFIFYENDGQLSIDQVTFDGFDPAGEEGTRLGDILVKRGDISMENLETVLHGRAPIGDELVRQGHVAPEDIRSALAEQEQLRKARRQRQEKESVSSVRVPADRLDTVVDLVGELVVVQARLSDTAAAKSDQEMLALAEEVERLTSSLRDSAMTIRMMPIGNLFTRFNRVVRDLARSLGREVEMVTTGAETELDKTVIEQLGDPLIHLIRNSLDHGIELPHVREATGKQRKGRLEIDAQHTGASVMIRIRDDGAGIDAEGLRQKAVEQGVIPADKVLNHQECLNLIFHPGLSTAAQVSDVSGRGVGMDVVKRNIESLRGAITISSKRGEGTEITVELPLTLAIIDGLLVSLGKERFIIPLSSIEECVELPSDHRREVGICGTITVRENMVPYIRLRRMLHVTDPETELEQIIIGSYSGDRFGLVVDRVIGQHQTVIKPLSKIFQSVPEISGASILGDGRIALIIDMARIHQTAQHDQDMHRHFLQAGADETRMPDKQNWTQYAGTQALTKPA